MEYHCPPQSFSDNFVVECWEWDVNAKSPAVQLSPCRRAVYFHIDPVLQSEGTAGVRGTKGFIHGEHYWEVKFLEPPYGTSVMVGAGTRHAHLHLGNYTFINMLGMDSESWGLSHKGITWHDGHSRQYTEPFYEKATIIGVDLNLYDGTMTFYKNGCNLGVAFTGLNKNMMSMLHQGHTASISVYVLARDESGNSRTQECKSSKHTKSSSKRSFYIHTIDEMSNRPI
ncbi:SPRY domain-containing SOCS box protein 3 isoform X2 [Chiloscyllium plagiosum]|uniref:SPRY domain-containing SOCS box protein 3 isoform X2 n=1 Tax=Chiloscyllium plagiosum TaxID=36176 RepID=UPI001CB81AFE|nr:SPRY domain-containing SOCS box protein 3 isoform X2 [Chiloscyllium plagiosum]